MSTDNQYLSATFTAGATLTGKQYYAVKLTEDKTVGVCTAQGEAGLGVLMSEGATGDAVKVIHTGVCKARAGASITFGQKVTTQADGEFEPASASDYEWGVALEDAASGDIFSLLLGATMNVQ